MPLQRDTLEKLISDAFKDAKINITDLAGDNDHWSLEIISNDFVGKSRIQQHKMVYSALQGKVGGQLHALQLKTSVPK
jgi:stress-induced morphogen